MFGLSPIRNIQGEKTELINATKLFFIVSQRLIVQYNGIANNHALSAGQFYSYSAKGRVKTYNYEY